MENVVFHIKVFGSAFFKKRTGLGEPRVLGRAPLSDRPVCFSFIIFSCKGNSIDISVKMSLKIHKYQHIRQNSKLFSAYSSVFLSNSNKKFSLSFLPYTAKTPARNAKTGKPAIPQGFPVFSPYPVALLRRTPHASPQIERISCIFSS